MICSLNAKSFVPLFLTNLQMGEKDCSSLRTASSSKSLRRSNSNVFTSCDLHIDGHWHIGSTGVGTLDWVLPGVQSHAAHVDAVANRTHLE